MVSEEPADQLDWSQTPQGSALGFIEAATPPEVLIPFTWALSRMFNALVFAVGVAIVLRAKPGHEVSERGAIVTSLAFAVLAVALVLFAIHASTLPTTQFEDSALSRPWDALPFFVFLVAAFLFRSLDRQRRTRFTHALVVSTLPDLATQIHMTFGSEALFDAHFNAAHGLEALAYVLPLVGLTLEYLGTMDSASLTQNYFGLEKSLGRVARQLTRDPSAWPDENAIYRVALEELGSALRLDVGRVHAVSGAPADALVCTEIRFESTPRKGLLEAAEGLRLDDGRSLPEAVLGAGRAQWIEHIEAYPRKPRFQLRGATLQTGLGIPIRTEHGIYAVLEFYSIRSRAPRPLLIALCQSVGERLGALIELLRVNASLVEAREAAQAADRAKSDFLANMSHEIRTPLNGVIGALDVMMNDDLSPRHRAFGRTAVESANLLLGLLNDVLDISKLESGAFELEHVAFDLSQTMNSVSGMFAPLASEKGTKLSFHFEELTEVVWGDPTRGRQVLVNLVGNAIKFTEKGRISVRLEGAQGPDGIFRSRFEIRDTGCGISEDRLSMLFQKIQALLDDLGMQIRLAEDGEAAVRACEERRPDVVLMDCQMPRMDGFEATRELRRRFGSELCIVALTANALSGDREACLEAGMNDFLSKPIEKTRLEACLKRHAFPL